MSYQVDFDTNNRILRARFIGRVTDDELRDVYRFGQENVARFDPLSGITDFSEVTAVAFSPQTMRDLARIKPIMPDPTRPVIFIAPAPDLFGMGRIFELEGAEARPNLHVVRTAEEWRASPQGVALSHVPPVVIRRIGDAPPLRLAEGDAPLAGIRVLDLTRVLAGPTVGRTLASYGADVLHVRAERLPTIPVFDLDTGHGKRSTFLDLAKPGDAETLRRLAREGHIFVESYRPGGLAKLGFSAEALAHSAPGTISVSVSCYGNRGAWAERRGWEQLAQCATGLAVEQGAFAAIRAGSRRESVPKLIPVAACDYITGYLGAAGAIAALLRRIREGGSWSVEVSLSATAMWLQSLARVEARAIPESWKPGLDVKWESCKMARGQLDFLGPVVQMSRTPPRWRRPPPEPGADPPSWLE